MTVCWQVEVLPLVSVAVQVTVPGAKSPHQAGDVFTYDSVPTVTSVSPTAGKLAGGTVVTVTGTRFTGMVSLEIGDQFATNVGVQGTTVITGEVSIVL